IKLSINTIVNRTDHLQQFIDNYRKLTMLASPKKQVVAPERILQLSVETLMPLFKQNKITVHTDFSLQTTVEWDAKQMEQVFINLLTNAIHATAKQEIREININLYEKNNRICIDVEDSGAGILPEIKEKIFIPFYTTREEGAGIGLPLSKNIVEMHNGYLTYHRREDKTVFSLNFPMY
ncbi:MAG: sensor histidine kinase, partial [Flavobacterium sp.]